MIARSNFIFLQKRGKRITKVGGVVHISVRVASYLVYCALARPNVRMLEALVMAVRDGLLGRFGVSPLSELPYRCRDR